MLSKPSQTIALILATLASPLAAAAAEGGGVSPAPYVLTKFMGLPITNSMVTGWIVSIILILAVRFAVGRPKAVPGKGQAVMEGVIEGVHGMIEPIVGKRVAGPALPILFSFFFFILIHNWSGLFPGVGTIGIVEQTSHGPHLKYFFRPADADMNMTLALAIVHIFVWLYFIFKYAGPKLILHDLFGNKADKRELAAPLYMFLGLIFVFVGLIEVISIAIRPVSLSFRLFGNIFGGENLLTSMTETASGLFGVGALIPVPFYFLEILIGLVQALVFTLLVAVYIGLITNHETEEGGAH